MGLFKNQQGEWKFNVYILQDFFTHENTFIVFFTVSLIIKIVYQIVQKTK